MELFEEASSKQYVWKLFYTLNNIPCQDSKTFEENIDNIIIRKTLSTGFGLNIAKEEAFLNRCRHLQVFTKEIELALLSGDKETYLYKSNKEDVSCEINTLDIIGRYVYITENEICSPNCIQSGEMYTNRYFKNFKDYVLKHSTSTDGYSIAYTDEDKHYSIQYNGETLFEIVGAGIHITYPFTFYVLRKLADLQAENVQGYENAFKVIRVQRREV